MSAAENLPPALVDAALSYAAKNLPVFPCNASNKRPLTEHGFEDASTDPETIRRWWARWPDAMIGMPTGKRSGFWALDIDDPALFEGQNSVEIPETRRCDTGKGYHLLFRFDLGAPVTNSQRHPKRGWPFAELPGAEARGEGGYVIVPPSVHPSGKRYAWHDEATITHAPDRLLAIVRRKREASNDPGPMPEDGRDTSYGLAALQAECEAIRSAPEGAQEAALNEAALKIGSLVAGRALSYQTARSQLIAAGLCMPSHDPRHPWTAENVTAKVDRSMADGARNPRSAPARRNAAFAHGAEQATRYDPATGEFRDKPTVEGYDWPEPVDLWRHYAAPELPRGLLPDVIETFARRHGEVMGVDAAGLAMAALAVCSSAISDEIKVKVKRHDNWTESARLWVGLIGAPSMKKSPILNAAVRPLRSIDAGLMRSYMSKRAEYDALSPKERKAAKCPPQERRMIMDSTIEAAQEVLRDSPRGVLSVQDELSGWFGAMDKYAPGKGAMADRGFWLQAFNGGPYSLNRVSRGACYIPNCSIGLLGGVQPEPIRAIANDTHDDGLIQRLIPVVLRPGTLGRDVPADEAVERYDRLIERLDVMRPPTKQGAIASDEWNQPLEFDEQAKTIREGMEAEHLELVGALEGISPKLAAHFGKHDGLFARLCVLWQCVETEQGTIPAALIGGATADRVARFMREYIRPSAIAFYAGLLGMSAGHEDLVSLAAWIVASEIDEVKPRDVQSSGQALRHVSADEVRLLCEKLEACGWGRWADPAPKSNKPRFLVNPLVRDRFEDRGKLEQERRAKARAIIQATLAA